MKLALSIHRSKEPRNVESKGDEVVKMLYIGRVEAICLLGRIQCLMQVFKS